jgi:hypothetical protein
MAREVEATMTSEEAERRDKARAWMKVALGGNVEAEPARVAESTIDRERHERRRNNRVVSAAGGNHAPDRFEFLCVS